MNEQERDTRDLSRAYRLLRQPVPPPAAPVPKSQDSWQQLKPGQSLANLTPLVVGIVVVPTGSHWSVDSVNSLGATLVTTNTPTAVKFRLTDADWKRIFERLRKVRTTKTTRTKRGMKSCSESTVTSA